MERIKTAVIGIGNMGTAHAQSLWEGRVPGLALAAVCDADPARLAYCEGDYPSPKERRAGRIRMIEQEEIL